MPVYVVLPLQELHDKEFKILIAWQFSSYFHLMLWNLNISVYTMYINYNKNLYIHTNTNHAFQKYGFKLLVQSTRTIIYSDIKIHIIYIYVYICTYIVRLFFVIFYSVCLCVFSSSFSLFFLCFVSFFNILVVFHNLLQCG